MIKKIDIGKNQKKIVSFVWSGKESEICYDINLEGENSEITLLMLLLGKKSQKLTLRTNVTHKKPLTKSKIIVKGAITDFSNVDFEGLVKIERGAKGSDAWLGSHLLLLSNESGGRAVPNLEIDENEVKAGHASTVGKVDENEIFYLMSRGLNRNTSTKLLIQGFLNSLINEFPLKEGIHARQKLKWY